MKFSEQLLKYIGNTTLSFILDNIKKGISYEGDKFQYSENNFYIPFSPKIYSAYKKDNSFARFVTTKSGKKGFIVFGYKKFKEKFYPQSVNNYLTASGKMLRDMNILKTSDNSEGSCGEIIIGFTDVRNSQIAFYLNVSGAGRGRKLWKFLGLSQKQIEELSVKYQSHITKEIAQNLIKNILSNRS